MKKLNCIAFLLLFSVGVFAQSQYAIHKFPLCWTDAGQDSSIYKMVLFNAQTSTGKTVGYYSPEGEEISVSSGNVSAGFCSGDTIRMEIVNQDGLGDKDTVIVINYDTTIVKNYDTSVININDTTVIICNDTSGQDFFVESFSIIDSGDKWVFRILMNNSIIHEDSITKSEGSGDSTKIFIRDDFAYLDSIEFEDTIRIRNGLRSRAGSYETGLGGELVENTIINALGHYFSINQLNQVYFQTNDFGHVLFPRITNGAMSFRFWSLGAESNRGVIYTDSTGAVGIYAWNANTTNEHGYFANASRAEVRADGELWINSQNDSARVTIDTAMMKEQPIDTVQYFVIMYGDSVVGRIHKSKLDSIFSVDTEQIPSGNLQGAEYAYMRLQNGDEIPNIDQAGITVLQLGTSQTNAGYRYQSPMYQFFREIGVPVNQPGFQQTSQLNAGESNESEGAGALTFSGDWVHYDGNTGGRSLNMTHAKGASVGAQITISTYAAGGVNTDKGIVYFRRQTNGGSFKVKTQNAGSYFPVVSTAGTEGEIDSVQYNYTSGKVDFIIEIETVGADSVEILGTSLFSKNEIGFTFHKAGHNGLGAFELAALSNYDFTRQLQLLEPVPDVVIIEHGTNDFDYDTSVLSINYDTIVSRIQSALPAAQILLLSPPDASLAFKNGKTIEEFEDFQKRAADKYKCSWFSQKNTLGDLKTAFNFTGIYAPDSIHLERAGGYMVTRAIFKHLFPGLTQNNSLSSMPGEGATVGQVPKWDGSNWTPQDDTDTGINNVNSVASNIPKMNSASQVGLSPMYAVGDYTGFGGATAPDAAVYIPSGKEGAAISGGLGVGFERINYREALYRYETTRNLLWNGTGYDLEHNAGTGWLFLNHIQPGGVNEEYSIWSAPSGSSPVTLTRHYVLKGQTGFLGLGIPYPENPSQRLHVRGNIRNEGDYYDSNNSKGNDGQVLRSGTTGAYWDDERIKRRALMTWSQNVTAQTLTATNTWYPLDDQGSVLHNALGGITGVVSPNFRIIYNAVDSDIIQVRCGATVQSGAAGKDIKVGFRKNTDSVAADSQQNQWLADAGGNYNISWEFEFSMDTGDYIEPVIATPSTPAGFDITIYNLQCRIRN